MHKQIRISFLMLVLVQGLHSIEEYIGKLWEVFIPAKFLSGLVSGNLETGFLVINISLFIFGLWCWYIPVRKNYFYARSVIWFWIIIEIINGIGHPAWALYNGGYVPGAATAPVLLALAVSLLWQLLRSYP